MEEMGKEMIKHCGGLPLAVKVLGGLLAEQYTLHEWERVYENIKPHITGGTSFNDKNISSVYNILYLSYEELPVYLKYCFLYLAHFPEDYAISVRDLSHYWAAEGIPKPRYYDGASTRDVGDGYKEELVKRNMVISKRDAMTSRYETCQLHDMMREVCVLKAEEESFVQIVDTSSQLPCKSRRLVVPKLRSLLRLEHSGLTPFDLRFTSLQLMRVLDLSGTKFVGKLPSSIGKLIHLRYLSLLGAYFTHLPSSMRNLKQLIYLNLCVFEGFSVYMPNFLKEIQKLAYLYLPERLHDKDPSMGEEWKKREEEITTKSNTSLLS